MQCEAEPMVQDEDQQKDTTSGFSISNASIVLANACIGSGVLAFPHAFSKVGVVLGVVTFFLFAMLLGFSLHVIVYSLDVAQRTDPSIKSYEGLVQVVGGHKLALFMEITMTLYLFGAGVAYQITMADTSLPLMQVIFGMDAWICNSEILTVLIATIVLFPLILQRNFHAFRHLSAFAVMTVGYMVLVVTAECITSLPVHHKVVLVKVDSDLFTVFPVFAFALGCHLNSALVYSEIKPSQRTPGN